MFFLFHENITQRWFFYCCYCLFPKNDNPDLPVFYNLHQLSPRYASRMSIAQQWRRQKRRFGSSFWFRRKLVGLQFGQNKLEKIQEFVRRTAVGRRLLLRVENDFVTVFLKIIFSKTLFCKHFLWKHFSWKHFSPQFFSDSTETLYSTRFISAN